MRFPTVVMGQVLFVIVAMAGALAVLVPADAQNDVPAYVSEQIVAPPVVSEGDFALRLAQSLGLSNAEDADDAFRALAGVGIEPPGGWVADYPMTPQIVTALRNAILAAVSAGSLDLEADAAMNAFAQVVGDFGLPLPADMAPSETAGGAPPVTYGPYCDEAALDYYYGNFGSPVYSYCPPPPAYFYLYAWVPCDFELQNQVFAGFFVLRDFDDFHRHGRHERHHRFADDDDRGRGRDREDRESGHVLEKSVAPFTERQPPMRRITEQDGASSDMPAAGGFGKHAHPLAAHRPAVVSEGRRINSLAAPRVRVIHRTGDDREWSGVRPVPAGSSRANDAVAARVVPTISHNPTVRRATASMRRFPSPMKTGTFVPVPAGMGPAPVPQSPVSTYRSWRGVGR